MKRATRLWLAKTNGPDPVLQNPAVVDILGSDARQRAEIRDLRAQRDALAEALRDLRQHRAGLDNRREAAHVLDDVKL